MDKDTQPPRRGLSGWIAGGGALAGLASFIGASCCVLPLLLAQVGLGAALLSQLVFFARAKPYLMALTVALIVGGLVASFWNGRRPRPMVLMMLAGALVLVVGAEILPQYEGQIMRWIGY